VPNGGDKPAYPGVEKNSLILSDGTSNYRPVVAMPLDLQFLSILVLMLNKKGNTTDVEFNGSLMETRTAMLSVLNRMPSWKMNGLSSYGPIKISIYITLIY
jgi:hypothetical protein